MLFERFFPGLVVGFLKFEWDSLLYLSSIKIAVSEAFLFLSICESI
jgi:hypothetical protein